MLRRLLPVIPLVLLVLVGTVSAEDLPRKMPRADEPAVEPPTDPVEKELSGLEGGWRAKTVILNGKDLGPPAEGLLTLIVTGDQYTESVRGQDGVSHGTIKVDPSKKPKWLNLVNSERANSGDFLIYERTGDQLKIAILEGGRERPTDFSGKGGGVVIYTRVPVRHMPTGTPQSTGFTLRFAGFTVRIGHRDDDD